MKTALSPGLIACRNIRLSDRRRVVEGGCRGGRTRPEPSPARLIACRQWYAEGKPERGPAFVTIIASIEQPPGRPPALYELERQEGGHLGLLASSVLDYRARGAPEVWAHPGASYAVVTHVAILRA